MKKFSLPAAGAHSGKSRVRRIGMWIAAIFAVLLPLKFGSIAALPGTAGFFPDYWADYLLIVWPSGALVLFVLKGLLCLRGVSKCNFTEFLWCLGVPLAALPGWYYAPGWACAFQHTLHLSVSAVAVYFLITAGNNAERRRFLLHALTAGVFLTCLYGFYQYFYGFAATREFVAKEAVPAGTSLKLLLGDNRVYSTFSGCNVLAGFLLLTAPAAVWCWYTWAQHFTPRRPAEILFILLGGGSSLIILALTRSRGAAAALGITAVIWWLSFRRIKLRWRLLSLFLAAIVLTGVLWLFPGRRGSGSLIERREYLKSAVSLALRHPILGGGWGSFRNFHRQHKNSPSDESSYDPHNPVLSFACQSGIPAALVVLLALGLPLAKFLRSRQESTPEAKAMFWGLLAFILHAMQDLDFLIPANVITAGMFALFLNPPSFGAEIKLRDRIFALVMVLFTVLATAAALWDTYSQYHYTRLFDKVRGFDRTPLLPGEEETLLRVRRERYTLELAADCRMLQGDFAGAEKLLLEAVETGDLNSGLLRKLARCRLEQNDEAGSQEYCRRAKEIFPAGREEVITP